MRFPVTNADFQRFIAATDYPSPESLRVCEPKDHPVWGVSFDGATAFAVWASDEYGEPLALPTESQWEYAARGNTEREYPFGDEFDADASNTLEAGGGPPPPADHSQHSGSPFGVFDLSGNVEEWTLSRYEPYPGGTLVADDLSRVLGPRYRILRGGSFAL